MGAVLAASTVVLLVLVEVARLRGAPRRARQLGMLAVPLLVGFLGIVVIRFFDLL